VSNVGLVLHRDSLGSRQLIRPGELNLMTAGRGVTHSGESAAGRPPVLHGLQLWIALPTSERHAEPRFAHHADLPVVRDGAASVTVAVGEYRGARSPAEVFSPLAGYEVAVPGGDDFTLPVREDFEHGVVAVDGSAVVDGALITPGLLAHLPAGRSGIRLSPASGRRLARFFVIGGRAVRRAPADVVELRGPLRRGDHQGPRGLGGWALRPGPGLPRRPADRPVPASRPPQAPLGGTGSFLAGITGAGLAKTSCCAVSSPAPAAATVMACADRG
jgi:hypothetical protein